MSWLDTVASAVGGSTPAGVAGNTAEGAVKGILSGVKSVIEEFHMSPEDKAKLQLALNEQEAKLIQQFLAADAAQIDLNKEEAKNANVFVSGWRPFIGWTCGVTLAYVWIVRDWLAWTFKAIGSTLTAPPLVMQDGLLELTLAMLGMAGLRTYEKYKGVHDK